MNKQTNDLRKKSDKQLQQMLKDIEIEQVKATSIWFKGQVDDAKTGIKKVGAKIGVKTSMQKDLRRQKARILTLLNERKRDNEISV